MIDFIVNLVLHGDILNQFSDKKGNQSVTGLDNTHLIMRNKDHNPSYLCLSLKQDPLDCF